MHKNARTITSDPINPVKNFDLTSKTMNQEWSNRQGKNIDTGYFKIKHQSMLILITQL